MNTITKTIKLYDADAYSTEFEASVLSCKKTDDGYAVVLDKTLFFPEEGGQSCDIGTIDGFPTKKVEIKNGIIIHFLTEPLQEGNTVFGKIDFAHRYRNMQHHSGEHIVSGLVCKTFGYTNVGFHLGKTDMTMDYDGDLSALDIRVIEDAANVAIYRNIEIIANYPDSETLKILDYRSKLDLAQDVRIVTIGKYDVCACCAPHVARTGEIGIIKIVDFYRYKGGTRLHAICGSDALKDYAEKHDITKCLNALLSTNTESIADSVKNLQAEVSRLSSAVTAVTKKYCLAIADGVPQAYEGYVMFDEQLGAGGMRVIANALAQKRGWCAVFDRTGKDAYNFIIASEKVSAKSVLALLCEKVSARGGGSDRMVQGSAGATESEIRKALDNISLS
ncbi:MAG: alanyl-tRNA editing protein [Ruminococcaceae bacterium]|nr:alanyl-tRNA editing protein [Oscillospiraceae bacterium]